MKTTQEILGGLACHAKSRRYMLECADCAYHTAECKSCTEDVHEDAMALIVQLEAQVAKLAEIVKPFSPCEHCKHEGDCVPERCKAADFDCKVCQYAKRCACATCTNAHNNWEWKGMV